jgi:hypothetical protein
VVGVPILVGGLAWGEDGVLAWRLVGFIAGGGDLITWRPWFTEGDRFWWDEMKRL